MDLKSLAVQFAMQKLGGAFGGASEGALSSALSALTGDKNEDSFDLGDLVSQLQGGGLGDVLGSWLGDGDNAPVSGSQVESALGDDRVGEFASRLGMDKSQAADALSNLLPAIVDRSSEGGNMLSSLTSMAAKFLR